MKRMRCTAKIKGIAPLQFSGPVSTIKPTGEQSDVFEERTWMERLHHDSDNNVFIPPGAIKNCLSETAQFVGEQIPGKGKSTYTKRFVTGIMAVDPIMLYVPDTNLKTNIKKTDVERLRLFVPSDGKRGGGKRVWKNFPVVREWEAYIEFTVLDPILIGVPEKLGEYLAIAGRSIGMLAFRPSNNGYFGRWIVIDYAYEVAD